MGWLKNAFIGSLFGATGLREELEHAMATRTQQMRNLMEHDSDDEGEDGDEEEESGEEGYDWESDKEEEREALEEDGVQKLERESGARTARLNVVRHIVA